jgi:hypothetical protein
MLCLPVMLPQVLRDRVFRSRVSTILPEASSTMMPTRPNRRACGSAPRCARETPRPGDGPGVLTLAELAPDGGREASKLVLENVVRSPGVHRVDGGVLADGPRHHDEGKVEASLFHDGQGSQGAESRHGPIGQDQIPGGPLEGRLHRFGDLPANCIVRSSRALPGCVLLRCRCAPRFEPCPARGRVTLASKCHAGFDRSLIAGLLAARRQHRVVTRPRWPQTRYPQTGGANPRDLARVPPSLLLAEGHRSPAERPRSLPALPTRTS